MTHPQNQPKKSYVCRQKFDRIYQFKISLKDIRPPIWRIIQVPEIYTFWDLHVAIQDAMGWLDCHLHEWRIKSAATGKIQRLGIWPAEFEDEHDVTMDWKVPITTCLEDFSPHSNQNWAEYLYDFGDSWEHVVFFEGVHARGKDLSYPCCIDGARACPPEDVGGSIGYEHLLHIMDHPEHKEYKDMVNWYGGIYDPEEFMPSDIKFWNPKKRLAMLSKTAI